MKSFAIFKLALITSIFFVSACKDNVDMGENNQPNKNSDIGGTQAVNQPVSQTSPASKNTIPVVPGTQYSSGTNLTSEEAGISLTVPANFYGGLNNEGIFALSSNDKLTVILMQASNQDVNTTMAKMSNTIDLGSGLYLQPLTTVSQNDDTLFAKYEVYGANTPSQAIVANKFRDQTQGVAIFAMTASEKIDELIETVNELTASLVFYSPTSTATQLDSGNYWVQQFFNMKLTRYYSASDYKETTTLYLCGDGRYRWTNVSSSSSITGSLTIPSEKIGSWSANGNSANGTLTVINEDASQYSYTITPRQDGVGVNLDGERYYRESFSC